MTNLAGKHFSFIPDFNLISELYYYRFKIRFSISTKRNEIQIKKKVKGNEKLRIQTLRTNYLFHITIPLKKRRKKKVSQTFSFTSYIFHD